MSIEHPKERLIKPTPKGEKSIADSKQHKHFYGWMYSEILRCMREELRE